MANIPTGRKAELMALLINGELYGFELAQAYRDRYGKMIPIGTLYTTMRRAEDDGFISSRISEETSDRGGNRRKYFKLTADGFRAAEAIAVLLATKKRGARHA